MATVDPAVVQAFLSEDRDNAPEDLQQYYLTFEDYWERKLWHELTDVLLEFFSLPTSAPSRLGLWQRFILTFADKINQLKLVNLGLLAVGQCKGESERLAFLENLASQVDKSGSQDAFVSAKTATAGVKLRRGDLEEARKDLERSESILDTFDSVETTVHARFYSTNSDYYQAKKDFAAYYRNALLYLACIDVEKDIPTGERETRAYDLSIAALVSDTIYNFGELLLHPILDSIKDPSPHAWLRELLFAFNRGDLMAFEKLSSHLSKNKLLSEHRMFLRQKISLDALTETVFKCAPHDRAMTFSTIERDTKVRMDEIEFLLMKALSLGLLQGTIDQVAQVANISWVQPKVLDMKQIDGMRTRLKEWDSGVNQLGTWMEKAGGDIWA